MGDQIEEDGIEGMQHVWSIPEMHTGFKSGRPSRGLGD